jgi:tetratricopeptide (TPR) repeat protein
MILHIFLLLLPWRPEPLPQLNGCMSLSMDTQFVILPLVVLCVLTVTAKPGSEHMTAWAIPDHMMKTFRLASQASERRLHDEVLRQLVPLLTELRADANYWNILGEFLLLAGVSHFELGQLNEAEAYFNEGLNLHHTNTGESSPKFLYELSLVALKRDDVHASLRLVQQAVSAHLERAFLDARTGFVRYKYYDLSPVVPMLCQLALIEQTRENVSMAVRYLTLARVIAERSCDLGQLGVVLNELGVAQIGAGTFGAGVKALIESIQVKIIRDDKQGIATTLLNIQNCINLLPALRADPEFPTHLQTLKRVLRR